MAFVIPVASGVSFAIPYFSAGVSVVVYGIGAVTVNVGGLWLAGAAVSSIAVLPTVARAGLDVVAGVGQAIVDATTGGGNGSGSSSTRGSRSGSGRATGSGGNNNKNNDDDDGFLSQIRRFWDNKDATATKRARIKGGKYDGDKMLKVDKKNWISLDRAKHGGAAFKQWTEQGRGLRLSGSLDEFGKLLSKKHESRAGFFLSWNDDLKLI